MPVYAKPIRTPAGAGQSLRPPVTRHRDDARALRRVEGTGVTDALFSGFRQDFSGVPTLPPSLPRIGQPTDRAEREAEAAADRVMRGEQAHVTRSLQPRLRRKEADDPEENAGEGGQWVTKADVPSSHLAPPPVAVALRRGGTPLEPAVRLDLDSRFGVNFSDVRIHADASADAAARSIGARAFTLGRHIVFATGAYAPTTLAGRRLLAHELTHTIQQAAEPARPIVRCQSAAGQSLAERYREELTRARATGNWRYAAELLNGFNRADTFARLAELSQDEIDYVHIAAVDNPAVGTGSQVADLTAPGAPRASTMPPRGSEARQRPALTPRPTPTTAPDRNAIASMSGPDKLVEAYRRAPIGAAIRQKLESFATPQAFMIALISFVVTFMITMVTPVGWIAGITMALTAAFLASAIYTAVRHLINFAAARNATTSEELDVAGGEFAMAVAEVAIDALLLLVMRGMGRGGATPPAGPPSMAAVRMGLQNGRVVLVAAESVPASVSAATASQGAIASAAMMSSLGGGGGPPPPDRGGGRSSARRREPTEPARTAEITFLDRLRERFPRLRELDIRPRRRPSASRYTTTEEPVEVGGQPQRRTEVSGAPEFAFEERMQTTQGNYSYVVYNQGRPVIELDGISVEGFVEEVKINQSMGRVDDIVAQLRVQADFAESYGLRGVRYSISPPEVAAEVEARVAQEQLRNCWRAE